MTPLTPHKHDNMLDQKQDPRPTDELIALALAERDQERRWVLVGILRLRPTREVLEAALRLCEGRTAKERVLGADILSQLGVCEPHFHLVDGKTVYDLSLPASDKVFCFEERSAALIRLLADQRVTVIAAAATGLGHIRDSRGVEPLVPLKSHPSAQVRYAVVFGLLTQEDERAIEALIELSEDSDEEVRDWATFGLGSQIDVDTPAIRDALFRRLRDPNLEARGEAMVGLARRKDSRVFEPLCEELHQGNIGVLSLEAALELADPRLSHLLDGLKERWIADGRGWDSLWDSYLVDAMAACAATAPPPMPASASASSA